MLNGFKKEIKTYSKTKKIWVIAGLLLLLTIPTVFLNMKIDERKEYKKEAFEFVSKNWGGVQTINSPKIRTINNKEIEINNYNLQVNLKNEYKKKGVFKIPVFIAQVVSRGDFKNNSSDEIIIFPLIDNPKNLVEQPLIKLNGVDISKNDKFALKVDNQNLISFEISYKIKGAKGLILNLVAKNKTINVTGNTKDVIFMGDYLPDKITYLKKDFSADWKIFNLVNEKSVSKIEISLKDINENYILAYKALKYSFFFLSLIFIFYFVFEIVSKKQIHPIQYLMLGCAILVFYLLLVAISEILPFLISYFLSFLLSTALISFYTYFLLTKKDIKYTIALTSLLVFLYFFFYILLKLEEYSFLVGSFGIFVTLGLLMYFTRKVEWFNEN